jgi:hypothetical protein
MLRKWLFFAAVSMLMGAATWHATRHFVRHGRTHSAPLQIVHCSEKAPEPEKTGQEESEAIEVIDLTVLPKQTVEPPLAGFDVPAGLPAVSNSPAGPIVQTAEPDVADFRPHAAEPQSGFFNVWKRVAGYFWSQPASTVECERLPVMPRPAYSENHPHEGCPYLGGCPYDGSQFRQAHKHVGVGEEEQAAPKPAPENLIPKPGEKHKQPKVDTMEIRPGDLPSSWIRRPF